LPIATPPAASASLSTQLDELATILEQSITDSATDWDLLSETLTSLYSRLEKLATLSRGLEQENESMRKSLDDLGISLDQVKAEARRQNRELWAWRIAAVLGLAAGAAGIGYGLTR
jgi:adenylosuccinate lyase